MLPSFDVSESLVENNNFISTFPHQISQQRRRQPLPPPPQQDILSDFSILEYANKYFGEHGNNSTNFIEL